MESISDILLKVELLTFEFSMSWELKIMCFVGHKVDDDSNIGFIECMMLMKYLSK